MVFTMATGHEDDLISHTPPYDALDSTHPVIA